ncbi:MAG: Ig domain-containing protein [Gemmatimonadetes bacterium]|nr:Ig domain-containing protein [Gemmatimonadota bacterium]
MSRIRHAWPLFRPGAFVLSAALLSVGMASCADQAAAPGPVGNTATLTTVTVTPTPVTLTAIGATQQLTATGRDANGNTMAGTTFTWTSSASGVATASASGLVTAVANGSATVTATSGTVSGTAAITVAVPPQVASVSVTPADTTIVVRRTAQLSATTRDSAGNVIQGTVVWTSSDTGTAMVSAGGLVTGIAAGNATVTATSGTKNASATLTITPSNLPVRGLYVQFERRGYPNGFWPGHAVRQLDSVDAVIGMTVAAEVNLELDVMKTMGTNTITYELRASDSTEWAGPFIPPDCHLGSALGLQWPRPTAFELQQLVKLFDIVQGKGMRVFLRLVNTHMEEVPRTNSTAWLGSILGALKGHPALDLVLFEGDVRLNPSGCGIPAEPPLWLGPRSEPALYVSWAIGYALSLGFPPRQLSAEAVVGFPLLDEQSPAGAQATDGHLWSPVGVLKRIFDGLSIPDAQRTYALSLYEHRKCIGNAPAGCVDVAAKPWTDQSVRALLAAIGRGSAARVVAPEMGVAYDPDLPTAEGLDHLLTTMKKYGVDGGSFWRWVNYETSEDTSPEPMDAVKRRGVSFIYNPVKDVVVSHYTQP